MVHIVSVILNEISNYQRAQHLHLTYGISEDLLYNYLLNPKSICTLIQLLSQDEWILFIVTKMTQYDSTAECIEIVNTQRIPNDVAGTFQIIFVHQNIYQTKCKYTEHVKRQ